MKALFELMSHYNKTANAQMISVLDRLDEDILFKDVGLHDKSIAGTIVHYTTGDILFFKNYFAPLCTTHIQSESKIEAMLEQPFKLKPEITENLNNLFSARGELDEYIINVVSAIADFSPTKTFDFPWASMTKPLYQFVWAAFNHATHHRGMIAGALDALKVENDFNGALGI
ncbi:hypothetical protein LS71_003240 [Helicobacter jaachi]|uniref:DinB family protein n=1 Tax=Helicobacter jaachi TaxID=1677920 RepID=A0A4U8TCS0_9HELI|nr:DinB family protein [Helicobacter jaachi]TLD97761.1 hypothetical protein LS71_003240 [Helicobacter jaachi]